MNSWFGRHAIYAIYRLVLSNKMLVVWELLHYLELKKQLHLCQTVMYCNKNRFTTNWLNRWRKMAKAPEVVYHTGRPTHCMYQLITTEHMKFVHNHQYLATVINSPRQNEQVLTTEIMEMCCKSIAMHHIKLHHTGKKLCKFYFLAAPIGVWMEICSYSTPMGCSDRCHFCRKYR